MPQDLVDFVLLRLRVVIYVIYLGAFLAQNINHWRQILEIALFSQLISLTLLQNDDFFFFYIAGSKKAEWHFPLYGNC